MATNMTSQLTPEQLRASTQRKHRNWNKAVMRSCDFCGLHALTTTVDLMAMCAPCCDAGYTTHLSTMVEMAADALEVRDKRIAELESRAESAEQALLLQQQKDAERSVNLPKYCVAKVMLLSGFDRQYAEGWCAGNDNARHEIQAAGISLQKGDE